VNDGEASWFDLAQEAFRLAGADPARVHPVTAEAFPRPAPRPSWSVLSTAAWTDLGLSAPRHWREALGAYLSPRFS
jgi:dTDP-4-dehydrorhamnose reductase